MIKHSLILSALVLTCTLFSCKKETPPAPAAPTPQTDLVSVEVHGIRDSIQIGIAASSIGTVNIVSTQPTTIYNFNEAPTNGTVSVQAAYMPQANQSDTMRIIIRVNGQVQWSSQGGAALIVH